MTKRYQGEEITLTVKILDSAGNPADPTTVAFSYRMTRDGPEENVTPTKTSVGNYSVSFATDRPGNLFGSWVTTGTPLRAIPVTIPIYPADGIVPARVG